MRVISWLALLWVPPWPQTVWQLGTAAACGQLVAQPRRTATPLTCCLSPPPLPTLTPCSLLVLLIVALFYAGAAIIYRLALSPNKDQKLLEAQRRRRTRRD